MATLPVTAAHALSRRVLESNLAAINAEHNFTGIRQPDADCRLVLPSGVVNAVFEGPNDSPWLRGMLGAGEGEEITSLGVTYQGSRRTALLRLCGRQTDHGTQEVQVTVRMVALRAGRLACAWAKLIGRQPNTDVHMMGWYGTGLPDPEAETER